MQLKCDYTELHPKSLMFQLLNTCGKQEVQVEVVNQYVDLTWFEIRDGLTIMQERNALKPHCLYTITSENVF